MTNKALDTTELLCHNQYHSRFTLRWLTFEGVYIWSILVPGYASEWQTLSKHFCNKKFYLKFIFLT